LIQGIHEKIRKEKSLLVQMKWITIGLWLGTLLILYFRPPTTGSMLNSGDHFNLVRIYLSVATGFIPMAAMISTLLLFIRQHSFSQKEISLRLNLIEAQLIKQEQGDRLSKK
jgi:Na+-driven multidrug efflux pump